jgi:hypothetical protein
MAEAFSLFKEYFTSPQAGTRALFKPSLQIITFPPKGRNPPLIAPFFQIFTTQWFGTNKKHMILIC